MKIFYSLVAIIFFTNCFAAEISAPFKDESLITILRQNQIDLIVMRHGEATHNLNHLMTSTRSPGIYLTDKGISQVEKSAHRLSEIKIDTLYVSPVFRTMQTANIVGRILEILPQNMIVDDRLKEQYFGDFEGKSYGEYESFFPSLLDMHWGNVPNGESGKNVFLRTRELLWEIALKHQNQTILLVTHGFNVTNINYLLEGSYDNVPGTASFKHYLFQKRD